MHSSRAANHGAVQQKVQNRMGLGSHLCQQLRRCLGHVHKQALSCRQRRSGMAG